MGLFGALFAGVSGLSSQSNKIGIISNNISNVNTVGFKQGSAAFNTLVVPSGTTSFSPGGVISNTQALISQQGLIQATSSPTDVAITGGGFFMVNTKADGAGDSLLTRAGSFTQDSLGNFENANGFFLQGIRVAPGQPNFSTLQTVNVNSSATGAATPTSLVTIAANFNAAQTVLLGSGEIATLAHDPVNSQNTASQIIIPTGGNALTRGDSFSINSVNAGDTFTLTYGGFAQGRDITSALAGGEGDGQNLLLVTPEPIGANEMDLPNNSNQLTIHVADVENYQNLNQNVTISGVAGTVGNVAASSINGERLITAVSGTGPGAGTITVTIGATNTGGAVALGGPAFSLSNRTNAFTGNILNATVPGGDLLSGITDPSTIFTGSALQFQIATGSDTFTFKYNAAADTSHGEFNSLNTLATAINNSSNSELTASVAGGRLYVSAADANNGVTLTNGDAVGSGGLTGINWAQELDLPIVAVAAIPPSSTTFRYNTLGGLANTINANDPGHNLVATLSSATGIGPTVSINETDPQSQVTFADTSVSQTGGSLINSLGFTGPNGALLGPEDPLTFVRTSTPLPLTYSAISNTSDMSSGAVTPQFTKALTIFDSLGNSHNVNLNVAKIGVNRWAVELTVVPASDLATVSGGTNDGQIGSGIVNFTTDGVFQSVQSQTGVLADSLAGQISINWSQSGPNAIGASPSKIDVDLTGLIQSAAAFNVSIASQNGSSVGELTGVSIDQNGFVIESFSNGQTQKAFQIPLASVSNPDGLEAVSGNAYKGTLASGTINPVSAGTNGTGTITPSALEQSNVDLSTQLTNLIVAQQAYGANSKVLTIADQLLQQLDQIIQ